MACKVAKHPKRANLYLRLWWLGRETWEASGLPDTKGNRARLQRIADAVTAEIRARIFTPERYLYWFPNGRRAPALRPSEQPATSPVTTLRVYYSMWLPRYQTADVRPSRVRDYRLHLERYVLPAVVDGCALGELPVAALKGRHIRDLRAQLAGDGLATKTVKNIVAGSLRALVRDAMEDELLTADPFVGMRWERTMRAKPDPFTVDERDAILAWFFENQRAYHAFVHTQFFTGMRPSETAALRWSDIDLRHGTVSVSKSRHMGMEAPPKTEGSNRTFRILPGVVAVLRDLMPLHVDPDGHVFRNRVTGGPLDPNEWARQYWRRCLRAVNIRARRFYCTRHAYISWALSHRMNVQRIAQDCGTSLEMIHKHYGRWMPTDSDADFDRLAAAEMGSKLEQKLALGGAKPVTIGRASLVGAEKVLRRGMVPTGVEPVLPT